MRRSGSLSDCHGNERGSLPRSASGSKSRPATVPCVGRRGASLTSEVPGVSEQRFSSEVMPPYHGLLNVNTPPDSQNQKWQIHAMQKKPSSGGIMTGSKPLLTWGRHRHWRNAIWPISLCVISIPDNGEKVPTVPIFGHQRSEIWPTCPKIESFLMTHLIRAHTIYEVDLVVSIPNNCGKPPIAAIFRPPDGRNLANVAKIENKIISIKIIFSVNLLKSDEKSMRYYPQKCDEQTNRPRVGQTDRRTDRGTDRHVKDRRMFIELLAQRL